MPVSSVARPTGHPGYSQTMPCTEESAETARRLVRTALSVWGLEHLAADGALVVTGLAANAAQHTSGPLIRVSVTRPASGHVRIAVVDRSVVPPQRREVDEYSERGRGLGLGLGLIESLTDRWGTDLLPFGKRVWGVLSAASSITARVAPER
jgi:serine/threonine-protein kinase RsbW